MNKRRITYMLVIAVMMISLTGCDSVKKLVNGSEETTTVVKVTTDNQYTVLNTEEEIIDYITNTMKNNKTVCYFNLPQEEMIDPARWREILGAVNEITVEYAMAQEGYNVVVSLDYWDYYPIIQAYETNDMTILTAKQLELFDKYYEILNLCTSEENTDYENEESIHDYIVSNIEYGNAEGSYGGAYGAIMEGNAVCGGYAEVFLTLMEMLGIDCKVVTGTGNGTDHGWNMVCLDGEWYHVDTTWDDPINNKDSVSHKYFNLTDTEISIDHEWNRELYPQAYSEKYAYYLMGTFVQVHNQEELDAYIVESIQNRETELEFVVYGEVDLKTAFSKGGVALQYAFNIAEKSTCDVYDITITYN